MGTPTSPAESREPKRLRVSKEDGWGAGVSCRELRGWEREHSAQIWLTTTAGLMTASRIQIAGRFKPYAHMGCFDLEAFIEINQRSRKWQCPICLKNYSLENIIIDPRFNSITSLIKSCGDDTSEIDAKLDGSWRVKGRSELNDLTQWHLPDGTLCVATGTAAEPKMFIVKHEMKEESTSEEVGCDLKLGIRKNNNGQLEITKSGDTDLVLSSDNDHARHMENKNSTLSGSIGDTNIGDEGYNLEPARNDYPTTRVHDLDSSASDENAPPSTEQGCNSFERLR
ncbi:hypothetical protein C2845_PM04G01610 [Panicum miliaceum]|uniref:SP-RING-type domain-containing protein n=1 Tax=Panicum miliaceum TaxID=4540 RepID=A0A3L6QSZ6_PANMI|nr:hypothetical protein C2845_PM04G01610 [Panicum miliaceum]